MINFITKISAQDSDIDQDVNSLFHNIGGPDADLNTVVNYVDTIITVAINLAGIVALLMIFYATIIYVTSYGDDSKIETAKKTLLWSIIGLVFVAVARILVYILKDTIN